MKLTHAQRKALEWLAKEPWESPWWGGRPHAGWPREMREQTFYSLWHRCLIEKKPGKWSSQIISITDAGRAALTQGDHR